MASDSGKGGGGKDGRSGGGAQDARAERLAAALRENLKRRKAQARGRASGPQDAPRDGTTRKP